MNVIAIAPHIADRQHRRKYAANVELLGFENLRRLLPVKDPERLRRLLQADRHLNNVSLVLWDARHADVVALVRMVMLRENRRIPWSLCCTVCTLKETARQVAEGKT